MKAVSVLLLAAAGLVPALGYAQSTSSISYDVSPVSLTSGSTVSFYIPKFDNAGGLYDLTGVTLTFDYSVNDFGLTYTAGGTSPARITQSFTNTIWSISSTSAGLTNSLSWVQSGGGLDFSVPSRTINLLAGQSGAFNYENLDATVTGDIAAGYVDLYSGAGSVQVNVQSLYGLTTTILGDGVTVDGATGGGTIAASVTYTYAIPEPATYALVFGALTLGLVGWRRFRK
ncbi:MAG TPA: PEP-CTERM sorting domain-containing protein [Opitutaceae bacterium]|nr:PEP-CTERM sorting domain-containing protein [Opitutaceae bacterium]